MFPVVESQGLQEVLHVPISVPARSLLPSRKLFHTFYIMYNVWMKVKVIDENNSLRKASVEEKIMFSENMIFSSVDVFRSALFSSILGSSKFKMSTTRSLSLLLSIMIHYMISCVGNNSATQFVHSKRPETVWDISYMEWMAMASMCTCRKVTS